MLGGQEDGGVEGAADVPEAAGSWPAVGSVGMEEASVIVPRSYCVDRSRTMMTLGRRRSAAAPICMKYLNTAPIR